MARVFSGILLDRIPGRYILAQAVIAASFMASAQSLTTEVVVDRTVVNTLPSVSPLSVLQPVSVLSTGTPVAPEATEYSLPTDIAATVGAANTPLFGGPAPVSTSRGYVSLGYFPVYRLAAAAGYKIIDNRTDILRATVSFNGESHHTPLPSGTKTDIGTNDVGIGLSYGHTFASGMVASAAATYAHTALREIENLYTCSGVNRAGINVAIRHNGTLDWNATAWLRHFGVSGKDAAYGISGASEQLFGLAGHITSNEKSRFGLNLSAEFRHSNSSEITTAGTLRPIGHKTEGIIGLNPSYDLTLAGIAVRVGAHIDLGVGCRGAVVRVAPDVSALWHPGPKAAVYASFGGGKRFNTLAEEFSYSPYSVSFTVMPAQYTPVDARAGIRLGSYGGFTGDIHVGFADTRAAMRPSQGMMVPVNISGWTGGIELTYSGFAPVEMSVSADCYAAGSISSGFAAVPDGAKLTLDATVTWHVNTDIDVRASYTLRSGRRYISFDNSTRQSHDLGNVSDLSLRGDWRVSERLSVFAQIDNILCRRYFLLSSIASPRLHGLVGATVRF